VRDRNKVKAMNRQILVEEKGAFLSLCTERVGEVEGGGFLNLSKSFAWEGGVAGRGGCPYYKSCGKSVLRSSL